MENLKYADKHKKESTNHLLALLREMTANDSVYVGTLISAHSYTYKYC